MKTKIFYGRDLIGRFACDGRKYTRFQMFRIKTVRFIKKVMIVMFCMSALGWAAYLGSNYVPRTVYAEKMIEVPVEMEAPVMERIARCESSGNHKKDGQVIFKANTNGTVDIGRYQINSIWNKKATEMGLDLTNEQDNKTFAMYLYKTHGTEPWYASKACWNK